MNDIYFKRDTQDWFFFICLLAIPLGIILSFIITPKFLLMTFVGIALLIIQEKTFWMSIIKIKNEIPKSRATENHS